MKNLLLFVLMLLVHTNSYACHISGAQVRYEYNGKNYTVFAEVYAVCKQCNLGTDTTATVRFVSKSTSDTLFTSLKLTRVYRYKPGCLGDTTNCDYYLSTNPGYIACYYQDTVSLPPATDWIVSYEWGARMYANLATVATIYIENRLNTAIVNSSPTLSLNPAYFVVASDSVRIPLQSIDLDGDSIVLELDTPLEAHRQDAEYVAGNTPFKPLGPGSYCSINGDMLTFYSPTMGYAAIGVKIHEYRNGVEISNSMNEFAIAVFPATQFPASRSNTPPYPLGMSNMLTSTCPGSTNRVAFSIIDDTKTDSVFALVTTPAIPGWIFSSTVTPGKGRADVVVEWTAPASFDPAKLRHFFIDIAARDNECPNNRIEYKLGVRTRPCTANTVWPGDANSDNVVDLYDPLAIAIAYNETGPARTGANISWMAQACNNWASTFFADNVNMKHADCDGSGAVNNADMNAVSANYNKKHDTPIPFAQLLADITDAQLYLDTAGVSFEAGKSVAVPVKLGTAAKPMIPVYGIATQFKVTGMSLTSAMGINTTTNWLRTAGVNIIDHSKSVDPNALDWTFARTNHTNIAGNGQIGVLNVFIPSTVPNNTVASIIFDKTKIIDSVGRVIGGYGIKNATFVVKNPLSISQANIFTVAPVIIPNPSDGKAILQLALHKKTNCMIDVIDVAGRVLWQHEITYNSGTHQLELPAILSAGVYFVKLKVNGNYEHAIKWIKH